MRKEQKKKLINRARRLYRTRRSVITNSACPRLSVFRSLKHFYLQIIDDQTGRTLVSASDKEIKGQKGKKPIVIASEIGKLLAQKAKEKKVKTVVFDRGAYQYHGRVKAAADGAREGGLQF